MSGPKWPGNSARRTHDVHCEMHLKSSPPPGTRYIPLFSTVYSRKFRLCPKREKDSLLLSATQTALYTKRLRALRSLHAVNDAISCIAQEISAVWVLVISAATLSTSKGIGNSAKRLWAAWSLLNSCLESPRPRAANPQQK